MAAQPALVLAVMDSAVGLYTSNRDRSGFLWGALTFFTGLIGVVVYLFVVMGDDEDSQPTRVCSNCSASLAGASQYCSERRAELDETSDYQPMIEESVPGFVDAIGFSGHGFMQAPATGQLVAEIVDDRAP